MIISDTTYFLAPLGIITNSSPSSRFFEYKLRHRAILWWYYHENNGNRFRYSEEAQKSEN